jgi:hypothetical protein
MFTISNEQFFELGGQRKKEFAMQLIGVLREDHEEARQLEDERFFDAVAGQIDKALGYGIFHEKNIAVYVVTAFLLGASFDEEFPAVQEFLPDESLDEDTRANALQQWGQMLFESILEK